MRDFLDHLHTDIRSGQESWRVLTATTLLAILAALGNVYIPIG